MIESSIMRLHFVVFMEEKDLHPRVKASDHVCKRNNVHIGHYGFLPHPVF